MVVTIDHYLRRSLLSNSLGDLYLWWSLLTTTSDSHEVSHNREGVDRVAAAAAYLRPTGRSLTVFWRNVPSGLMMNRPLRHQIGGGEGTQWMTHSVQCKELTTRWGGGRGHTIQGTQHSVQAAQHHRSLHISATSSRAFACGEP
jgi:hypothetical protein